MKALKCSSNTLRRTDRSVKKLLRQKAKYYKKAIESGDKYMQKSTERFGENPLPWEPGGEKYFPIQQN